MFKHQGDVTFNKTASVQGNEIKHSGSFVLALGEKTGHKHVITVERPEYMSVFKTVKGEVYLELRMAGIITHEEHQAIVLDPGIYRVDKEREMDWFSKSVRQVID